MLLGPTVDTFEARADCRANELTLTRGRERTVQDGPCTLLHGPIGRFLYRPPTEHCYDKPIKNIWPYIMVFCRGIGAACMLLKFFFRFERESVQNGVFSLYSFLGEERRKAITRLKGFGSL